MKLIFPAKIPWLIAGFMAELCMVACGARSALTEDAAGDIANVTDGGSTTAKLVATSVSAARFDHTCAILSDGSVRC